MSQFLKRINLPTYFPPSFPPSPFSPHTFYWFFSLEKNLNTLSILRLSKSYWSHMVHLLPNVWPLQPEVYFLLWIPWTLRSYFIFTLHFIYTLLCIAVIYICNNFHVRKGAIPILLWNYPGKLFNISVPLLPHGKMATVIFLLKWCIGNICAHCEPHNIVWKWYLIPLISREVCVAMKWALFCLVRLRNEDRSAGLGGNWYFLSKTNLWC